MGTKFLKKREVAKLVTENRQPCVFCNQDVDDEVIFGKLYSYGDIQCHYFCVLLSCCLVQKGRDSEGLFGFLYKDILAEVERSKKHKCSYCGRGGASLGCAVAACRKQFHLPCGRRKNAVSLFYGNYKSFCELHAPKQKISDDVMVKAKERMKIEKLKKAGKIPVSGENLQAESSEDSAMVCVICYEEVQAYPSTQTFWPPCCGRDAWLHRSCLQRMALSAGMHYLKCPLCNDKDNFYDAVCDQGYYLPDRDAAWELEQNAFAEIYNRDAECAAAECKCPFGRSHDEFGMWDIKLCLLCGSWGMHAFCSGGERPVCVSCRPAATDIEQLETRLTEVIMAEQALERQRARGGPVMPSRMSLRRTKGRTQAHSATSSSHILPTNETQTKTDSPTPTDRLDLNLKPPRRAAPPPAPPLPPLPALPPALPSPEGRLLSPLKMLQQTYLEKGGGHVALSQDLIEKIRLKFSKPKPLSAKKKIVNEILDDLFKNVFKENPKSKDPVREWNSPKKSCDITSNLNDAVKEIIKATINTNTTKTSETEEIYDNPETESSAAEANPTNVAEETGENNKNDRNNSTKENFDILDADNSDKENDLNLNNDNNETTKYNAINDDESSSSTFVLPSEFVAESNDDDSLPLIETPKKLKLVDIKQDSIEISEKNEIVNIEVIQTSSGKEKEFIKNLNLKSPVKNKMFSFKFSPLGKEPLKTDVDMDEDSFKDKYLNEVDRDKSNVNHSKNERNMTANSNKKRKLEIKDEARKKRKNDRNSEEKKRKRIKFKIRAIDPEKREKKRSKKMKNMKELNKKIVRDKHVSIKIRLKDASNKNNKIKKSKKIQKVKSYKQYVLKYSPLQNNKVIAKPEVDITPMKRKYTKPEKSPLDNLVQTSIQSFFFKSKQV